MLWQTVERSVVSLTLLTATLKLARDSRMEWLLSLEPATFFVFLSHGVGFLLLWGAWKAVFGDDLNPAYLLFYFLAPACWFLMAMYLRSAVNVLPGFVQVGLTGRRSSRATLRERE